MMIAHLGDVLHGIDADGWNPILLDGEVRWISRSTVRRRTPESHNDRSPRQETGVEGLFAFWQVSQAFIHRRATGG